MNDSNLDWQSLAALLIVAAAVGEILRRAVSMLLRQSTGSGCGGCSKCPAKGSGRTAESSPLIQLARPKK